VELYHSAPGTALKCTQHFKIEKSEEKKQCGGPRQIWEGNVKVYIKETGCEDIDWICVAQERPSAQFYSCDIGNICSKKIKPY
jgi:hypothetical protein